MSREELLAQLNHMTSESRHPDTLDIDLLSTRDILKKINSEDATVAYAVAAAMEPIAKAVDTIVAAFSNGGRLIYIGAGTSGRLGVLDAAECPPTFSVPHGMVVGIIAGGTEALQFAVEGAEDSAELGKYDLQQHKLNANDVVVGIAASGRTPYVIGALDYAKALGAATVSLSCNASTAISKIADIAIEVVVGPEVLTGSTRMKSGTGQKLVLNMLTTASMIRCGKSYQNLMVDLTASNEKLLARSIRIVMQATECSKAEAENALKQANNQAKLAILMILTGVNANQGEAMLIEHQGFLRKAIEHS